VANPGIKRSYSLVSFKYWWPGMRKSIANYVKKCDSCQRYKSTRKCVAPLGEVEEQSFPLSNHIGWRYGPYPTTPRKNKYLLTFIDYFTKYTEAFPIQDQTAETCARVYATQIITRHGTGWKLITEQGRAFMSVFFRETCKILGNTQDTHHKLSLTVERHDWNNAPWPSRRPITLRKFSQHKLGYSGPILSHVTSSYPTFHYWL